MNAFVATALRELRLGCRRFGDTLNPMAFYIIVTSMFALGIADVASTIQDHVSLAVIWVVTLMAVMFSLDRAFYEDHENGSLELMLVHQESVFILVLGVMLARWVLHAVPILLLVPLSLWMFNIDIEVWSLLVGTLGVASLAFVSIAMFGAAATRGIEHNGLLLALLTLPLYIPLLLLGIGSNQRFLVQEPYEFAVYGIAAIALGCLTFAPFAIAAMLKASQEY